MHWCAWLLGCPRCWFLAWTLLRWGPQIALCMHWKCWCCQGQESAWPKLHLLCNGTWQKKQTLPSNEMNENEPVKSLYTTPLFLSANAPKQKTFAMDSLSSIPIRLGPCNAPYAGPWYGGGCWKSGKTCGKRTVSEVALYPLLPWYCVKLSCNIWCRDYQYVFYLEKIFFHLGKAYSNLISPSI